MTSTLAETTPWWSFSAFSVAFFVQHIANWATWNRAWTLNKEFPKALPDIGNLIFPDVSGSEILLLIPDFVILVFAIRFAAQMIQASKSYRQHTLRDFWLVMTQLTCLRIVTIHCTLLPSPLNLERCAQPPPGPIQSLAVMSTLCNDMVFSGHTGYVVILTSFLLRHPQHHTGSSASRWFRLAWWCGCVANAVSIVLLRFHYSLDVVLGFVIACLLCERQALRRRLEFAKSGASKDL